MQSALLRGLRGCALMLLCMAATACSSLAGIYHVNVDSMARQDLSFKAVPVYEFQPDASMRGVRADDLFFRNVANQVSSCLASRGMREAQNGEKADVVVYLSYGVGDARQETGVENIPSYRPRIGLYYWNDPFFFGDDMYYRQRVYTYTSYLRWLEVSARRVVKGKPAEQLWVTRAESRGSSEDLYNVLPWLLEAMRADFAGNTYGTSAYEVRIDKSGPVEILRKE